MSAFTFRIIFCREKDPLIVTGFANAMAFYRLALSIWDWLYKRNNPIMRI